VLLFEVRRVQEKEEVEEEREGHETPEQRYCVAGGALGDSEDEKQKRAIIAIYCEWDDNSSNSHVTRHQACRSVGVAASLYNTRSFLTLDNNRRESMRKHTSKSTCGGMT
jgi:hypothetical protein